MIVNIVFLDTGAGANVRVISLNTLRNLYNDREQTVVFEPSSVKIAAVDSSSWERLPTI